MYKKNLVKATSVLTAFALACSTMAGCGLTKKTEDTAQVQDISEESPEAEELVETMTKTAFTGNKENAESGKEETVYVMTDANGAVDEVVVSNWLKNANGDKSLTDTTNLKDIVNVKGDESFKDNGDGTVTWDAEGSDIYYQGTPTEEVPVGVKVTYELDGKQMKAEDIAGKSGSVKIRFDYTNSLKAEATIDGKKEDIDVPFTMISGTMLDNEKFANVKVSNGKVISDANNYVVVGVAMPGLKESLKIDDEKLEENDISEEDVDIPDFVEITADVQDFELPMTVSMASANVVSDLGLDKIYNSDKIDDLNGDMDDLSDASTQLRDGSGELADGTEKFEDGTTELYDGVGELKDGTGELKSGVGELKDGAGTLKDGTGQLKDGTGELKDGAGQLASGSKELANGASTLSTGIGSYADAVGQIASGAKDLDKGVGTLKSGASELSSGITSAKGGTEQLKTGAAQLSEGLNTAADGVKQQLDVLKLAKAAFEETFATELQYAAAMNSSTNTVNAAAPTKSAAASAVVDKLTERIADTYADELTAEIKKTQDAEKKAEDAEKKAEDAEKKAEEATKRAEDAERALQEALNNQQNNSNDNDQSDNSSDNDESQQNDDSSKDKDKNQDNSNGSSDNSSDESQNNSQESNEGNDASNQEASSQDEQPVEETDNADNAENTDNQSEEAVTLNDVSDENQQVVDSDIDQYADATGLAAIYAVTGFDADKISALKTAAATVMYANSQQAQQQMAAHYNDILDDADFEAAAVTDPAAKRGIYVQALAKLAKETGTTVSGGTTAIVTIAAAHSTIDSSITAMEKLYGTDTTKGLKDLQSGASQLAVGINSLYDGMKKLDAGGTSLSEGVGTLKDGTSKLSKGASKLNANSDDLKNGGKKLAEGAGTLAEGAGKLSDGTGKLYDGVVELNDGTGKLYDGVGKLYDGATELDDGAGKLKDGAGELKDGAVELNDGARKLADGMVEFDEEGIQQLTSKVDDGIVSMTDRLKAIDEASQSYTSFSGANADEPSTVQFIIRTAPVKSDND